jgi:uncharacterized protein
MCTERSSKTGGLKVAPSAIDCHVHPWDEVSVQHLGGGRLEVLASYLDDIAADFPQLTLISAHPGWPWQDEQVAMARHKGNVSIDLSGWAPKYFPPQLVPYARTILQDRVLFGSDWPVITPERWLEEFDRLGFEPEVRNKILVGNASALFGVTEVARA